MSPILIDLLSDSETEESPKKVAKAVLNGFQPRKQKPSSDGRHQDREVKGAADVARSESRSQWSWLNQVKEPQDRSVSGKSERSPDDERRRSGQSTRPLDAGSSQSGVGVNDRQHDLDRSTLRYQFKPLEPSSTRVTSSADDRAWCFRTFHAKEALRKAPSPETSRSLQPSIRESDGPAVIDSHKGLAHSPGQAVLTGAGLSIIDASAVSYKRETTIQNKQFINLTSGASPLKPPKKRRRVNGSYDGERAPYEAPEANGGPIQNLGRQERSSFSHSSIVRDPVHLAAPAARDSSLQTYQTRVRSPPIVSDGSASRLAVSKQLEEELLSGLPDNSPHAADQMPREQPRLPPSRPNVTPAASSPSAPMPYTVEDDRLLARLKEVDDMRWPEIVDYFPGRSLGALQVRYSTKVKGRYTAAAVNTLPPSDSTTQYSTHRAPQQQLSVIQVNPAAKPAAPSAASSDPPPPDPPPPGLPPPGLPPPGSNASEQPRYTVEDDILLARLKELDKLSWAEIIPYFPGRSAGALQVRYSTKVKGRYAETARNVVLPESRPRPQTVLQQANHAAARPAAAQVARNADVPAPRRRARGGGTSALDGFISWAEANEHIVEEEHSASEAESENDSIAVHAAVRGHGQLFANTSARILRQRELGMFGRRGWVAAYKGVSEELRSCVYTGLTARKHHEGTSGDVTCLAWASDGRRFAAGSIAISDETSMQYNSGLNLLLGDCKAGQLQELREHHVARPVISAAGNVNALHSMRDSQDPRLFMTVAAVNFSPDGRKLYTAGADRKLRMYQTNADITKTKCNWEVELPARVDLLDISQDGVLASGCHTSSDGCLQVYNGGNTKLSLSPSCTDCSSSLPIFPAALKWGLAPQHRNYLLAGFSSDSNDEARDTAGETCLWQVETGQSITLSTVTRNVFDVAWNPSPSAASVAFCVASTPGAGKSYKGKQTVVQCYAPNQNRARQVLEWECPAYDINDIVLCQYDDNLTAAGATDGNVYVWDRRFASRNQRPLHVLAHGDSTNVLDHDRDRELADTGVRFLSWGATSSRLYSGSSDGVVKVWDPYRASSNAHVEDVATFKTAVMSGAFSPDYRDLLIGEERGAISLLSLGLDDENGSVRKSTKFKLHSTAPTEDTSGSGIAAARAMLASREMEIRPMGALPVRQAVQGPDYRGPHLTNPSNEALDDAQQAVSAAMEHRDEVQVRAGMRSSQHMLELQKADENVQRAEAGLEDLQRLMLRAKELAPAAEATQKKFRSALREAMKHEDLAGRCKLDCNYLPPRSDAENGVPDSLRSEQRVPGALLAKQVKLSDVENLDCQQLLEAGMASNCNFCVEKSTASTNKRRFLDLQCRQRCKFIQNTFDDSCDCCHAPLRRPGATQGPGAAERRLCERCNFSCFRCNAPTQLLPGSHDRTVYCSSCGLAWEVCILGYELVHDASKGGSSRTRGPGRRRASSASEIDLSYREMMRLHARWQ